MCDALVGGCLKCDGGVLVIDAHGSLQLHDVCAYIHVKSEKNERESMNFTLVLYHCQVPEFICNEICP